MAVFARLDHCTISRHDRTQKGFERLVCLSQGSGTRDVSILTSMKGKLNGAITSTNPNGQGKRIKWLRLHERLEVLDGVIDCPNHGGGLEARRDWERRSNHCKPRPPRFLQEAFEDLKLTRPEIHSRDSSSVSEHPHDMAATTHNDHTTKRLHLSNPPGVRPAKLVTQRSDFKQFTASPQIQTWSSAF
eukprot:766360-Hanusia_phi.AAC.1